MTTSLKTPILLATVALLAFGLFGCFSTALAANMDATKATMIELDDTHTAYVLSYGFGFLNRELTMPEKAVRTGDVTKIEEGSPLTYALLNADDTVSTSGKTIAVIMNNATTSGENVIKSGDKGDYTLLVLHEHAANDATTYLAVTSLPFVLIEEDGKKTLGAVNEDYLKTYTTKSKTKSSYIQTSL